MTRQKPASRPGTMTADDKMERLQEMRGVGTRSSWRETIESVVVAFVLAFLFRTFEAEAFVIPTGSMAPTLLGRHKEVYCPQCGERYTVGASEEEPEGNRRLDWPQWVVKSVCPNCRYVCDLERQGMDKSYTGDRILVQKFPYELSGISGGPKRWDVFVFRYPMEAQTNYIKRLIGLPNEQIMVHYGDILVRKGADGPFQIARKPLDKQRVLEMLVFNNDHQPKALAGKDSGWQADWQRWRPDADAGWTIGNEGRTFDFVAPAGGDTAWHPIAYRHIIPTPADWKFLAKDQPPPSPYDSAASRERFPPIGETGDESGGPTQAASASHKLLEWDRNNDNTITADEFPGPTEDFVRADHDHNGSLDLKELEDYLRRPRPQLITDFYAYDTEYTVRSRRPDEFSAAEPQFGRVPSNWVGDLTLHATVEVREARGGLRFELNEGVDRFACEFDLATGVCTLRRGRTIMATGPSPVVSPGTYRIALANIDQRLTVWVDDRTIFGDGVEYDPPRQRGPTRDDLRPATVAFRGTSGRIRGLVLNRDIYYTLTAYSTSPGGDPGEADFALDKPNSGGLRQQIDAIDSDRDSGWFEFLSDSTRWEPMRHLQSRVWPTDGPLGPDQFLAMGDNSPRSKDSRMWRENEPYGPLSPQVDRRLLVGRAWLVYWPNAPLIPPEQAQTRRFPLQPQLSRMRFIK